MRIILCIYNKIKNEPSVNYHNNKQNIEMETVNNLVNSITKGIQEKKGKSITILDLKNIDGAVTNYFVICQGGSPSQVEAIATSVEDTVRETLKEKPVKVIGVGSNQWVAMDYVDVMVHIFLPETRDYYNLENLWQDAQQTDIPDID